MRKEEEGGDKHDPFTKILLKGPSLKQAFDSVRATFEEFDRHKRGMTNAISSSSSSCSHTMMDSYIRSCNGLNVGYIDFVDMEEALNRLGGNFTKAEIDEAFNEGGMADSYDSRMLTFKEFLTCLAIGFVLHVNDTNNYSSWSSGTSIGFFDLSMNLPW